MLSDNEEHLDSFDDINDKTKLTNEFGRNIISSSKSDNHKYKIDYTTLIWIIIITLSLWSCIDRFTSNLWPLWVNSPGPFVGDWSVSCFVIISWVSGRLLLVSSAFIFLLQCRCLWNWVVEHCPKWLFIGDIIQINDTIHYHVGWSLIGIPVCLHVWSIFWAVLWGNDLAIYSQWVRPIDPNTGAQVEFYAKGLLSLSMNDIYRLITTSLSFFLFFPYSMITCFQSNNYSIAMWIHLLAATLYTVDLIRMYSHPHTWFFNCPIILLWMIDRLYSIFWYRRMVAIIVKKIYFDDQYMLLYLRLPNNYDKSIGDVYYLNVLDCNFDRAHPFSVFSNHKKQSVLPNTIQFTNRSWEGHKFSIHKIKNKNVINKNRRSSAPELLESKMTHGSIELSQTIHGNNTETSIYQMNRKDTQTHTYKSLDDSNDIVISNINNNNNNEDEEYNESKSNKDDENDTNIDFIEPSQDWDIGTIIQVFPKRDECYNHRNPWTMQVAENDPRLLVSLRCWGPYRSEYRLLKESLLNNSDHNLLPPIALIGTGAGGSYIIDFIKYIQIYNIKLINPCYIYFSTRSIGLFQYFTNETAKKPIQNVFINAHLTSHNNKIEYNSNKNQLNQKDREAMIGRMSFQEILHEGSKKNQDLEVYFCGSPYIQKEVQDLCRKLHVLFHKGHAFYA